MIELCKSNDSFGLINFNDAAVGIKLGANVLAKVYKDGQYGSSRVVFSSDNACFSSTGNSADVIAMSGQASSLKLYLLQI